MIPHLLKLLLEKAEIYPSETIIKLVEKESIFAIPKFIDVLIDLAYNPQQNDTQIQNEAIKLIDKIIDSSICFEMLRHLFSLQGPPKDRQIKSIKGNTFIKALPQWKQNSFDCLIRRISMKKGGIRQLMLTLIDMLGNERNQKVAGEIAKCICRPPNITDLENHYRQLSIQIIDLLQVSNLKKILNVTNVDEKGEHGEYLRFSQCVALECVHLCARINKQYAQNYLLNFLFEDFYKITDLVNFDDTVMIMLSGEELIDSLNLHCSLLNTLSPSLYIQQTIRRFSSLYLTITTMKENNNKYKSVANEILLRLIELVHVSSSSSSAGTSLKYIKSLAELEVLGDERHLNNKLMVRSSLDGDNIEVAVRDSYCLEEHYQDDGGLHPSEEINKAVVAILQSLPNTTKNDIVSELFLWLLECHFTIRQRSDIIIPSQNDAREIKLVEYRDHLLSLLCTEMESHCFTKSIDILKLAHIVIGRYDTEINQCNDNKNTTKQIIDDNLNYALSMIVCVLEKGKLKEEEKYIFDQLYPLLQHLRDTHHLEKTRDLITDISIIIATHGYVNYLSHNNTALLIEEDDDDGGVAVDNELQEAFSDIDSEEVPVKGHGLLVIYKLLKANNKSALKHRNKIYNILSQMMFHSDSFIYLRAISGLSIIGDRYRDKMIPMVAQRLRACRGKHSLLAGVKEESSLEDYMKLSELFMMIINRLGDIAPLYRDIILSSLLSGLRDEEELVRASSLSNLAELCSQNDYIFSSVIYEMVTNVCNVIVTEHRSIVKKAASLLIRKLLLGHNDSPRAEVMNLFPGDILLTIHRSLKTAINTETDGEVLQHLSVTFGSLDESVRLFVFPDNKSATPFEKKIRIFDIHQ